MSIIAWLVLGLIAGFIASKLYAGSGQGVVLDIVLGIVGAFVGGFLVSTFGAAPGTGFNIYSMDLPRRRGPPGDVIKPWRSGVGMVAPVLGRPPRRECRPETIRTQVSHLAKAAA